MVSTGDNTQPLSEVATAIVKIGIISRELQQLTARTATNDSADIVVKATELREAAGIIRSWYMNNE